MNMLGWDKDEYLNTFQIRYNYPLQSHYIVNILALRRQKLITRIFTVVQYDHQSDQISNKGGAVKGITRICALK